MYITIRSRTVFILRDFCRHISKDAFIIPNDNNCFLENVAYSHNLLIKVTYKKEKGKDRVFEEIKTDSFPVQGYKSIGKRLISVPKEKVNDIKFVELEKQNEVKN